MTNFAYLRISTDNKGQTTDNQRKLIEDSGYAATEWYSDEGISGSTIAGGRPGFASMMSNMQSGDTCIITMLDRLGRSASDILNTIEEFKRRNIRLRVLQFDGIDITSSMGKMIITCMAAMAELERNILIERTNAGLARTRAAGTKLGAPYKTSPEVMEALCKRREEGALLSELAEEFSIPIATVALNVKKWVGKAAEYKKEYEARKEQHKAAKEKSSS